MLPKHLHTGYSTYFRKWFEQLSDFNLLFFGQGSKKQLLQSFASQWLVDGPVVVMNGYFPGASVKNLLDSICRDVIMHEGKFPDLISQLTFVRNILTHRDSLVKKLYILIHNIDGNSLRSTITQEALAQLACIPAIRFVASIDHLTAPLMWDHSLLARFRWSWHEATTYDQYETERLYAPSIFSQSSTTSSIFKSVKVVLQSLTPNHRALLRILAECQLSQIERDADEKEGTKLNDSENTSKGRGLTFNALFRLCSERMVVSNDVTLRSHLAELLDHCLVKLHKTDHRGQVTQRYEIPFPAAFLKQNIIANTNQSKTRTTVARSKTAPLSNIVKNIHTEQESDTKRKIDLPQDLNQSNFKPAKAKAKRGRPSKTKNDVLDEASDSEREEDKRVGVSHSLTGGSGISEAFMDDEEEAPLDYHF